jgi:hypothetical protein
MGKSLNEMTRVELKDLALDYQAKTLLHARLALSHAYQCGLVLQELKRRFKHGEWQNWRTEHLAGISRATACNYMRVAEFWDDSRVQDAKTDIEAFLAAIRNPRKSPTTASGKTLTPEQQDQDAETRKYLAQAFRERITDPDELSFEEANTLARHFDEIFWPSLLREVRQRRLKVRRVRVRTHRRKKSA